MNLQPFERCEGLSISADAKRVGDVIEFAYLIEGETADVVIPPPSPPLRTDGLWRATCFEAFIAIGSTTYVELNFSPSGQWAAYRFTDYRQGMHELDIEPPRISFIDNNLVAVVELEYGGSALNLTSVIEHKDGTRSYWALAHPKGDHPDFHTRDCFVASLP